MKKRVLFVTLMVAILMCLLALSVGATDVDPNADYYDKVYVSTAEVEMALYEKDGDTYYPLVWFAYDVLDEDGTTVLETKYVKARFEDVTMYSEKPSQGRFNGVYYEYTDENGDTIVLDSKHAVLLNMRGGIATKTMRANGSNSWTDVTIITLEWSNTYMGYPSFTKLEAVYLPLSAAAASAPSTVRVFDIDRHHEVSIGFGTGAFRNSKLTEIFIPGSATGFSNGNSQFQWSKSLETIIFGKGFNQNIGGYTFQDTPLKRVYWMGTKAELEAITISTTNNSSFLNLTRVSLDEYLALDANTQANGKYLIYDVTECYLWGHTLNSINNCVGQCSVCNEKVVNHNENINVSHSISYTSYVNEGTNTITCLNEGCGAEITDTVPAIFECLGYSTPMNDGDSLTIGFTVNNEALDAYTANTGKTVKFGMFATKYESIDGTILDENGNEKNGAIKADINIKVTSFDFILTGFETDVHKNAKLALGAYVIATDAQGEGMEISYMQFDAPEEGYSYITYNDALANNKQ